MLFHIAVNQVVEAVLDRHYFTQATFGSLHNICYAHTLFTCEGYLATLVLFHSVSRYIVWIDCFQIIVLLLRESCADNPLLHEGVVPVIQLLSFVLQPSVLSFQRLSNLLCGISSYCGTVIGFQHRFVLRFLSLIHKSDVLICYLSGVLVFTFRVFMLSS